MTQRRPSALAAFGIVAIVLGSTGAPATALADPAVAVQRTSAGRIELVGPDCAALSAQAVVLRRWTQGFGEGLSSVATVPVPGVAGCTLDVTADLPRFVQEHHGQHPAHSGPNCWNTSLVLTGLTPSLRYANPDEMTFWMGSPLCRVLGAGEARRMGDVVAIRRPGWASAEVAEEHGFIYLSDELSFSKNGYWNGTAFELQPTARVFSEYGMGSAPAECLNAVGQPSGCGVWANTYRCRSLDELLSDKTTSAPQGFRAAHSDMNRTECLVEQWALSGTEPPSFRQTILDSLAVLDQLANQELAIARDEGERFRFLWGSLLVRSASLREQLEI